MEYYAPIIKNQISGTDRRSERKEEDMTLRSPYRKRARAPPPPRVSVVRLTQVAIAGMVLVLLAWNVSMFSSFTARSTEAALDKAEQMLRAVAPTTEAVGAGGLPWFLLPEAYVKEVRGGCGGRVSCSVWYF
jgi:hypothetical protein